MNGKIGAVTRFQKETLTWKIVLKEKSASRTVDQLFGLIYYSLLCLGNLDSVTFPYTTHTQTHMSVDKVLGDWNYTNYDFEDLLSISFLFCFGFCLRGGGRKGW